MKIINQEKGELKIEINKKAFRKMKLSECFYIIVDVLSIDYDY